MNENPYGDIFPNKTRSLDPELKSEDIGGGVRILTKAPPPSVFEDQISRYDNKCFIKRRSRNEFWISRSMKRMCVAESLKYDSLRNEFTKVLANETAQVITVEIKDQDAVRKVLSEKSREYEQFIVEEILPHSLALSSSLERATQIAQVVSQDPDITLDSKYIQMSHTDAMSLKTIDFFLTSSGIEQSIKQLYLEQFVLHKFGGQKSQTEKSLDLLVNTLKANQSKSDQSISLLVSQLKKPIKKNIDE